MAHALEAELHYPLGDQLPAPGRSLELASDLRWVRMTLPFALDHVNLWLLGDEAHERKGWAIVDCGISDEATRAAWLQVFDHDLAGAPVQRVFVTHMHPDHIGLAQWLCEHWGAGDADRCRLWISASDWYAARMASQSTTGFGGAGAARHFARHGLTDPDALDKVRARTRYYPSLVPEVPPRFRRLMHGQEVAVGARRWRFLAGFGHAPEHISLYDEAGGVLISGDMLLPRISTNVSVIDIEPEADPLSLFLQSLKTLEGLPADTLVLPSHGRPFIGLRRRIEQLKQHHEERLDAVRQACRQQARSAAELLPTLFHRPLDLHQTTFAMGEAIAHLHHLLAGGELRAEDGPDGVRRFATMD